MARADRTGKRIPRSAFKNRIPDLGRYFIYTDADETEEKYMYGLRDAYFGTMHADWLTSPVCCQRFGDIFEKRTGQEYIKSNPQNYNLLTRFGDENTAIKIAEERLQHYLSNGQTTPSKMCPCTTLHHLVGEILRKTVLSKND